MHEAVTSHPWIPLEHRASLPKPGRSFLGLGKVPPDFNTLISQEHLGDKPRPPSPLTAQLLLCLVLETGGKPSHSLMAIFSGS